MKFASSDLLRNREEAGRLISNILRDFNAINPIVVGMPPGGAFVASAIAEELNLALELMPCRKMRHPADPAKTIGSVCTNNIFIRDFAHDIPQDYVYHQVIMLQHAVQRENRFYYRDERPVSLQHKTVILVEDVLKDCDAMIACLRSVRKEKPLKIIATAPIVTPDAIRIIRNEADDVVFLHLEMEDRLTQHFFAESQEMTEDKVREVLLRARNKVTCI